MKMDDKNKLILVIIVVIAVVVVIGAFGMDGLTGEFRFRHKDPMGYCECGFSFPVFKERGITLCERRPRCEFIPAAESEDEQLGNCECIIGYDVYTNLGKRVCERNKNCEFVEAEEGDCERIPGTIVSKVCDPCSQFISESECTALCEEECWWITEPGVCRTITDCQTCVGVEGCCWQDTEGCYDIPEGVNCLALCAIPGPIVK